MLSSIIIAFILYFLIVLAIGFLATYHSQKSIGNFISGNRTINWWVTAISANAADMSDWLFMGLPAAVYLNGGSSIWVAISLIIGMTLAWQFLAPALNVQTGVYKVNTLPSFFEIKYQEKNGRISILSSLIMVFFFTLYIAAGIKGVGYILNTTFGLDPAIGGALTVSVTLAYTLVGGFIAAAWVDFFQGIFLLCALMMTSLAGYFYVGGYDAIAHAARLQGMSLSLLPAHGSILSIILGPAAWGLGYFGMPHILSKFMGAKDASQMYKSKYVSTIWQILALSCALLTGFVAIAFFTTRLVNPEKLIFIEMTNALFPAFICGLILCGILSATLSTINAQMLVFAGVITDDIYKKWLNSNATQAQLVRVFRCSVICVAFLACLIVWWNQGTIFTLVQFAWGGLGASFGPLTLLSLYYHKINRHGAFFGILAGGASAVIWKFLDIKIWACTVNEMIPGFAIGLITIVLVSHLTNLKKH